MKPAAAADDCVQGCLGQVARLFRMLG